ncbi:MAG: hypothetical protein C4292_04675 [Nitrososphaera sp.]
MSSEEYRFTDGNLLVVYAVHRVKAANGSSLPDYVQERIKLALETYNTIMKSRPDKHKTMVLVVGEQGASEKVRDELVRGGVRQDIIAIESGPRSIARTLQYVYDVVSKKPNPPFIYFIASVWLHETFNATVVSIMKDVRVQFYGALDHRPVHEVEAEKATDAPKKGKEYYKRKLTNKAVDTVLNIIFPD